MSTTINKGWLTDNNGNKFAPKTLLSQVQTSDGKLLEVKIAEDILVVKDELSDAIESNKTLIDANTASIESINIDISAKANQYDFDALSGNVSTISGDLTTTKETLNTVSGNLTSHTDNIDIHTTAEEKAKLSGIEEGATKTIIDTELSSTSTNPVENKAVQTAIQKLADEKANINALPSKTSDLTNDSGFITVAAVNTHNTATDSHNDIRLLINELTTQVGNFLDVDDTTKDQLSELIALIEENADDIESITSGKVNVSDIVNNLTTNVSNKPLSAAQGVAIKALIDSLQGNLETHVSNADVHFTTTERTKLSGIATGAEVNQNAFSNVKVGSTTVSADSKTDTIEFVGSNVTITPDATNDKITFTVANGTTSAVGIVKLTDSVSSTDTTTAATPKNVKAAYDLANTAKTNAATAQATADGKADKGHKHTVSEVTDLTVTAAELNYMDGVTSNVQAQLNAKANASALGDQVTFTLSGTTLTITSK